MSGWGVQTHDIEEEVITSLAERDRVRVEVEVQAGDSKVELFPIRMPEQQL